MNKKSLLWIVTLLFLLLSMGSVLGATAPNPINNVNYYSLDSGSGTVAVDLVGNKNGTITNVDMWNSLGIINNSLTFTPTGLRDVNLGDSNTFSFVVGTTDLPFSFSYWVYHTHLTDFQSHFGKWGGTTSTSEYYSLAYADGRLTFGIYPHNSGSIYIGRTTPAGTLTVNNWHHVVITYNGNGASSGIKIYVDAVQVDNTNFQSGSYTYMGNTAQNLFIGSRNNNLQTIGRIDEFAIFKNHSLSQDEITYLYANGTPSTPQQYPFTSPTPPPSSNFSTFVGRDAWDNSLINNWTLQIRNATTFDLIFNASTTNGTIVTDINVNTTSLYVISASSNNYLSYERYGSSTDGVNAHTGVNISSYPNILFSQSMNSFNAKNILNETFPYYSYEVNTTNLVFGVTQETKMFNLPSSSIIELNVTAILGGSSTLVNVSIPSYCYSNDGNVTLWIEGNFLSTKVIRCDGTRQDNFIYSNSAGVTILPTRVFYQNISTVINGNNFTMFPLKFGSYTVQASSTDDYLTNYTLNIASNVVQTITIDNFTNQNVVLNITDFVTNAPLNYTGTITNVPTPFVFTGVNGIANVRTVKNYSYDLTINPILGYATNDLNKNFVTNDSLNNNFDFTLFQNNSVFLRFFDNTLNPFVGTVNITLFSNNITYTFNTNNSFLYEDDLLQGTYTITASASNFTSLQQIVTLNNGESQTVDFVFSPSLVDVKFTLIDNMGQLVSDATITATYIINGTSVVHSVKQTDLSGSLLMPLDQTQLYTLTISKVNYQTFIGDLVPFENEYVVNVVLDGGSIILSNIDDVVLNYNVNYNVFLNTVSFFFDINSASGVLNYWGYSYTLNNTLVFVNQTNPNGGNLQSTLNINTTTDPSLTVTYFFKTVNSGELSFNVTYSFLTIEPVNNLFTVDWVIPVFAKGLLTLSILLFFLIISLSISSDGLVTIISLMMGVGVSMLVGTLSVTIGSVVLIVAIVILIAEGRK